jgi:hypothetical protein
LATALGTQSAGLKPSAWRQLAFYAWDQDQAQLVSDKERTRTLNKLARNCLPADSEACTRLLFKSVISAHTEKSTAFAREQALVRIREVLSDPVLTRMNFDMLLEKVAAGVIGELSPSPESFYERNSRVLERMSKQLQGWSDKGQHADVIRKLAAQLEQVCSKLPAKDDSRKTCNEVSKNFKTRG